MNRHPDRNPAHPLPFPLCSVLGPLALGLTLTFAGAAEPVSTPAPAPVPVPAPDLAPATAPAAVVETKGSF